MITAHLCKLGIGRVSKDGAITALITCIANKLTVPYSKVRVRLDTVRENCNRRPVPERKKNPYDSGN